MKPKAEVWEAMMEECRQAEHPVLPVWDGEPWFSASYVCQHWLQLESVDKFVRDCKASGVPLLRIGRRPCVRLSDVLAMYRSEAAES
jgi:hypothetical protein